MRVLLKGVVGSTAYGLAHAGSDVDYLGVFAAPTEEILGLRPPDESVVTKGPDTTMHEAKKFVTLALRCNPTITELLWLDMFEHVEEFGDELIRIRRSFLSASLARNAYLGYATSQFKRLESRGDGSFSADTRKRTEKHARHLVRLVEQGYHLYSWGELVVNLDSSASEVRPEFVREMGARIADDPSVATDYMAKAEFRFDDRRSALPDRPDEKVIDDWLIRMRRQNWSLSEAG